MKNLTRGDFETYCKGHSKLFWFETDGIIINEQSKILADIFDEKNKTICSNCPENFDFKYKHSLKKENGENVIKCEKIIFKRKNTGCCSGCALCHAHFNKQQLNDGGRIMFENYKKYFKFDEKTGFFDVSLQTCVLPRQLRSSTCLGYYCSQMKFNNEEWIMIKKANRIIQAIKIDLKIIT